MAQELPIIYGRGATHSPTNRFAKLEYVADDDAHDPADDEPRVAPRTEFFVEHARSVLVSNDSPDVGFNVESMSIVVASMAVRIASRGRRMSILISMQALISKQKFS